MEQSLADLIALDNIRYLVCLYLSGQDEVQTLGHTQGAIFVAVHEVVTLPVGNSSRRQALGSYSAQIEAIIRHRARVCSPNLFLGSGQPAAVVRAAIRRVLLVFGVHPTFIVFPALPQRQHLHSIIQALPALQHPLAFTILGASQALQVQLSHLVALCQPHFVWVPAGAPTWPRIAHAMAQQARARVVRPPRLRPFHEYSEPLLGHFDIWPESHYIRVRTIARAIYGKVDLYEYLPPHIRLARMVMALLRRQYQQAPRTVDVNPDDVLRIGVLSQSRVVKKIRKETLRELMQTRAAGQWNTENPFNEIAVNQMLMQEITGAPPPCAFIAGYYGTYEDSRMVYLVFEHIRGGDLFTNVAQGSVCNGPDLEAQVCHFMFQLLVALRYLHRCGIANLDVSLENILLDPDGTLRLIDFGQAWPFMETAGFSCGKNYYRHPCAWPRPHEQSTFHPRPNDPGPLDMFAAGVVFYILAFQHPPWQRAFPGADRSYDFIRQCGLRTLLGHYGMLDRISTLGLDLLERLLSQRLEDIPTADEALHHHWFARYGMIMPSRPASPSSDNALSQFIILEWLRTSALRCISQQQLIVAVASLELTSQVACFLEFEVLSLRAAANSAGGQPIEIGRRQIVDLGQESASRQTGMCQFLAVARGLQQLAQQQMLPAGMHEVFAQLARDAAAGNEQALSVLADRLLEAAVEHMQRHREDFEEFHSLSDGMRTDGRQRLQRSFDDYLQRLLREGWGDQLTLRALADLLGVAVHIHSSAGFNVPIINPHGSAAAVHIGHLEGVHYVWLAGDATAHDISQAPPWDLPDTPVSEPGQQPRPDSFFDEFE